MDGRFRISSPFILPQCWRPYIQIGEHSSKPNYFRAGNKSLTQIMIKSAKFTRPIFTLLFMVVAFIASSQISRPSLSPRIKTEQKVGMVNVTLDYGQPNKQKRKIFGGLIPYNKLWRTGANASTKISFDNEVKLANQMIPAGSYALYTIPGEKQWTVIIYKNTKHWGTAGYDEKDDLVRFTVPVEPLKDTQETFSIHFEHFNTNGGDMVITWENTKISMPLFVDSDEIIFREIAAKTNPELQDISAQTYFDAAQFYYLKKKDLDQAMQWFNKAIELRPNAFWYVYYKAELLYHLGNYSEAKTFTEQCLTAAKASPSTDYGYIGKSTLLLEQIAGKLGK